MPNIFKLIKNDHDEGRDLMNDIVGTEDPDTRLQLFQELKTLILAHAKSEEKTFYDALKSGEDEALAARVRYLKADHQKAEQLFDEIEDIGDPHDSLWWEKFGELKMALEHHMEEEEKQIFPEAKAEIDSDEAAALGDDMQMREEEQIERLQHVAQAAV